MCVYLKVRRLSWTVWEKLESRHSNWFCVKGLPWRVQNNMRRGGEKDTAGWVTANSDTHMLLWLATKDSREITNRDGTARTEKGSTKTTGAVHYRYWKKCKCPTILWFWPKNHARNAHFTAAYDDNILKLTGYI